MRRFFLLLLLLSSFVVNAQVINKAEYFIDIDPGQGNGVNIPIGTDPNTISFVATVPTTGLTEGFHNLNIRTRLDNGIWSHYESRVFYLSKFALEASNVKAAEYFIDADPGNGNGIVLPVATVGATTSFVATIPTTGLVNGFHNLIIRTKNELGQWGIGENRVFYTASSANAADLTAAEFFIDNDPGVGSGTVLSIGATAANVTFTASIPTTGLTNGFHNLNVRTKNSQGIWGHYENRVFFVSNQGLPAADITAMEYFVDNDPGVGKGVAVAITTGSVVTLVADIATAGLSTGKHFLFLRAKSSDGWGQFEKQEFTIGAAVAPTKPIIASIDGKTTSPVLTAVNKPVIKGTSEANVTIEIFNGTTSLGTTTTDATGNWTFTPATALADGTFTITAKAKNASNLESPPSDAFVVTIDTQAPTAPTIVSVDSRTTQNFTTANNKPAIIGNAEASSVVEIFNGATKLGEVVADASGNYTFTPAVALADGNYIIAVSAKDLAGNVSVKSSNFSFAILNLLPAAPVIASVDGKTAQNFVTNNNKPVMTGTATALLTVDLFNGTVSLGSSSASLAGTFSFTPGTALPDGAYIVTSKAKNAANISSVASNSFSFIIDTQAPATPSVVTVVNQTVQNFSTAVNKPVITGKAEPGATVEIFSGTTSLGFVIADANGNFSFTPASPLPDGSTQITVKAKDAAGNTSTSSATFAFTIDTQPPPAPLIVSVDNKVTQNFITTNNKPVVVGTAEPGATVEIFNGNTSLGFATADASGRFTFTPPVSLADGIIDMIIKAKDAAGNTSTTTTYRFEIDATAPSAPIIASIDGKTNSGFSTTNNRPIVLGQTEANATLELFNGTNSFGIATVNASGGFTFTPASPLADGTYSLTAKAKDRIGNLSLASSIFTFIVDTSNPAAPVIVSVDSKNASPVTGTNVKPVIIGTAEANSVLSVFIANTLLGTTTVNAGGNWSFTPISDLAIGNHLITASAKDIVGNVSGLSNSFVYNLIPLNMELAANNVLTPNGDGKNDFLVVENLQYYPDNSIKIFDRAGRVVFSGINYKNNWDGNLNGVSLAEGTYYYLIDKANNTQPFKSFITVVRKSIR